MEAWYVARTMRAIDLLVYPPMSGGGLVALGLVATAAHVKLVGVTTPTRLRALS